MEELSRGPGARRLAALRLLAACRRGYRSIALLILVHASRRVHEPLFSREVRVARRTDTHAQVLHRGAGMVHMPAGAGNRGFVSLWMDVLFHGSNRSNVIWHSAPRHSRGRGSRA